jgi:hypothetical protein
VHSQPLNYNPNSSGQSQHPLTPYAMVYRSAFLPWFVSNTLHHPSSPVSRQTPSLDLSACLKSSTLHITHQEVQKLKAQWGGHFHPPCIFNLLTLDSKFDNVTSWMFATKMLGAISVWSMSCQSDFILHAAPIHFYIIYLECPDDAKYVRGTRHRKRSAKSKSNTDFPHKNAVQASQAR